MEIYDYLFIFPFKYMRFYVKTNEKKLIHTFIVCQKNKSEI